MGAPAFSESQPLPDRPYPGLRAFRKKESGIFFGRRRQNVRMINILKRNHFLAVVGTSGCGKSSLVRAGLLPALDHPRFRLGVDVGSDTPLREWVHVVARPGGGPFRNLAAELARCCPVTDAVDSAHVERQLRSGSDGLIDAIYGVPGMSSRNVLVVIDQFEEIFRFGDTSQRSITELERTDLHDDALKFVDAILSAVDARNPHVYIAITMRSDSLGRCDLFHGLPEAITRSQFLPPRLTKNQLLDAIRQPVELFNGTIEDAVVSDLLEAMGDRQDQLPVIQHALSQLWAIASTGKKAGEQVSITSVHIQRCSDVSADDDRLNWVTQAISKHADDVLASLGQSTEETTAKRRIARAMFCALSQIDNRAEPERRLSSVSEVAGIVFGSDRQPTAPTEEQIRRVDEVARVFEHEGHNFVSRSVADGREILDVSHESLLRHWDQFRGWLDEESASADRLIQLVRQVNDGVTALDDVTLGLAQEWREQSEPTVLWARRYLQGCESGVNHDSRLPAALDLVETSLESRRLAREERYLLEQQAYEAERQAHQAAQQRRTDRVVAAAKTEAERRRVRAIRRWLIAVAAIAVIAMVAMVIAIDATAEAKKEHANSVEQEGLAKEAAREAKQQRNQAISERAQAERHQKRSAHLLYSSQIAAAQSAWQSGNESHAWSNLDSTNGELRNWEYDYLLSSLTRFRRHEGSVLSVRFSPSGKWIVSGSRDKTVKVWDASTGDERHTLEGHQGAIFSVSFSPDGKRIASGGEDKTVKVWDASTGDERHTLEGHQGAVFSVSFSPDGKRIASGGEDKTVKVWDASTGLETLTLQACSSVISSVSFSPDGKKIVTGSGDKVVKLWDATTGEELLILEGHEGAVLSVSFSPDGNKIVSGSARDGSNEGKVKVWDIFGEELLTLEGHSGNVNSVTFSPDGGRIVSGSDDKSLKVWDASTGKENLTLRGHADHVLSVDFSRRGKRIVGGAADNSVNVWDASTGASIGAETLTLSWTDVNSLAFSPDGKRIVVGTDHQVSIWDRNTFKGTPLAHRARAKDVDFSPDGIRIVSGGDDKNVRVWNSATGETLTLEGHLHSVLSVSFSPDGKLIVSGSSRGDYGEPSEVKIWDALDGNEMLSIEGKLGDVNSVSFSPDGRIAIGSGGKVRGSHGEISVRQVSSGYETLSIKGHMGDVNSVDFSPDGKRIVSGSEDNTVKLWNASTGEELLTLQGHSSAILSVSFSPDGKRIVSGSEDKTVKLWDASSGVATLTLEGHSSPVESVDFSPNGKQIVSGGWEKVIVWDASSSAEVSKIEDHLLPGFTVSFRFEDAHLTLGNEEIATDLLGPARQIGGNPSTVEVHSSAVSLRSDSRAGRSRWLPPIAAVLVSSVIVLVTLTESRQRRYHSRVHNDEYDTRPSRP